MVYIIKYDKFMEYQDIDYHDIIDDYTITDDMSVGDWEKWGSWGHGERGTLYINLDLYIGYNIYINKFIEFVERSEKVRKINNYINLI